MPPQITAIADAPYEGTGGLPGGSAGLHAREATESTEAIGLDRGGGAIAAPQRLTGRR